ncbi:hypothetical protein EJ04DRAFT_424334 [Polyplosphaeria fusca]|uniref:Centromere protein X n=1 Tax=Polyplosphaeria fusca TaxID=682080 RepID=A0A9P4RB96_9PLEO|nr:hypothetical protein EJ04DRAFT_424334 [Polyplosphaeria fusca]
MPATKDTGPAKRGRPPAFKPPRPVKSAGQKAAAAPKRASAAASRPASAAKKAAPSASKRAPMTTLISSESEAEDDLSDANADEEMEDISEDDDRATSTEATRDPIPANLLIRLLYEGFEDQNTQIQKGAMELVGHYMNIFVREAIARARFERRGAGKGGISDGFLQVEDLEKLAPQLVLDF